MKRLKFFKKILPIIASITIIGSLSACSSQSSTNSSGKDSSGKITLKVAIDSGDMKSIKTSLPKVLADFEKKYPNITVKPVVVTNQSWADYFNKVQTMIQSGNAPDVVRVPSEGFRQFVDNGLAQPIDSFMKKDPKAVENINDYPESLKNAFVVDGKTYGLGWDWNNVVIHINTDMLKAAGLPLPPANWTLDDFLKYAKALTGVTNGKKHYGFAIPNYYFGTEAWLYNNDAGILNKDMSKSAIDSKNSTEVIQFFHDLIYKYKVSPVPDPNADQIQQFMSGQVGMIAAGRWPLGSYIPNNFKSVDIQFIPTMKTNQPEFGTGTFILMKSTKNALASYRLSMFLSGVESQTNMLTDTSIPTRTSVMDKALPTGPIKNYAIYKSSAQNAKQVQSPMEYSGIESIFNRYMSAIYSNQMPLQEALHKASGEIDSTLASGQ